MKRVEKFLSRLKLTPAHKCFIENNRRLFKIKDKCESAPIMLMELNGMHSAHIAYSYLANEMIERCGAQIKAYYPGPIKGFVRKLAWHVKQAIGDPLVDVYESFGVNEFIKVKPTRSQKKRARCLCDGIYSRLSSKRDVEDIHINGVWVGDLIYDSYLRDFNLPTIDLESERFRRYLLESCEIFVLWDDFISDNNVCGVSVSHCVYRLAIPLRIAIYREIPAFQANLTHVYRLGKDNCFAYNDFFEYRNLFSTMSSEVRNAGIELAETRIHKRFSGEVGVDMAYSTKSAYAPPRHERLIHEPDKVNVLIATHCFFDSPHSYGKNLFPDFYEWLDFLGQMTEVTDYDWYLKTHPDYLPGTMEVILYFIEKYPKFTLLPADASHHQIIAEGINVALTVYGTIGFEYAALGVPVINASLNNPHIAYDFNLHAKDVDDYRRLLLGLDGLDFEIDKNQVYEYYFMKHIYNTENIFFENYKSTIDMLGGYKAQFSPEVYSAWLAELTPERHKFIQDSMHRFVISNDFRMDFKHLECDYSVQGFGSTQ